MNKFSKLLKSSILASALVATASFATNICNSNKGDFYIVYTNNNTDSFMDSAINLISLRNSLNHPNTHYGLFYNSGNIVDRFVGRQEARLNSLQLEGNRVILVGNQSGVDRFRTILSPNSSGTVILQSTDSNDFISRVDSNVINNYFSHLTIPHSNARGFFTVTLTWDGYGDVDLHTYEPSGTHVYYSNKRGVSGYLDTDNTYANGPEHYYASCDSNILKEGIYNIKIKNYSRANGRTATLQISTSNSGEIFTTRVGVGNGEIKPVVKVRVSNNNGKYSATIVDNDTLIHERRE